MKAFFALLFLSLSLFASVSWVSLEKGQALIKNSPKIMMVMVSSPTCHYCTEMEEGTLRDAKVSSILATNFVSVKLMKGIDTIPPVYKTVGTPTFFFVDAKGLIVPKIFGAWQTPDFLDILSTVQTQAKGKR